MDYNLTAWVTLLSSLGLVFAALYGVVLVTWDIRVRKLQARQIMARAENVLNVDVDIEVLPFATATDSGGLVLETRVQVKNGGHETWCIPSVYVQARSLVDPTTTTIESRFYQSDVEDLPKCDTLSEPRNVARLERSIYQIAPDEAERFVRWDILDRDFVTKFPIIAVHVVVFCVPAEYIGIAFAADGAVAPFRQEWLDFMNGPDRKDMARHEKIIFSRSPDARPDCEIRVNDRVLLEPNSDEIDIKHTVAFRSILNRMTQMDRHKTVVLKSVPGVTI